MMTGGSSPLAAPQAAPAPHTTTSVQNLRRRLLAHQVVPLIAWYVASSSSASPNSPILEPPTTSTTLPLREPSSVNEAPLTGPESRVRCPPSYLSDYICHSAYSTHPTSTSPSHSSSSGTRFPIANFVTYDNFCSTHRHFLANVTTNVEPRTFKEVVQESRWRVSMQFEVNALEKNHTWDICALPSGKRPIGCK